MFKNLIRHSIRSYHRQRAYILINVLGLSIGIACTLLISFFISNELSFDRFNTRHKRIFRLVQHNVYDGQEYIAAYTPAVLGPAAAEEIPEVEGFLRMTRMDPAVVEYNDQTYTEDHLVEADSSFFNFFSVHLIRGESESLLNGPRKIVLSETTAKKIFGDQNPIDKLVKIGSDSLRYTVTGVMADIPENSHFEANIILSFMTNPGSDDQIWTNNSFSTYLLLKPNTSKVKADEKISGMVYKYMGAEIQQALGISLKDWMARGNSYGYRLQNLTDIHLDPSIVQEFKEAGDPKYLKTIGSLAVLIIIIAAINFMNLSTAQASRRTKEVGIKKVSGSTRSMLILQFLSESVILTIISLFFALVYIKVSLPYFNNLLGTSLALKHFPVWYTLLFLILFTLAVGLAAGSYPALFLSSFSPYEVLKGSAKNSAKNGWLRKVLVIFQFGVSILLIVGTILIYRQINYMLNKDPGFDREQIVVITKAETLGTAIESFKEAVKGIPGVLSIAGSSAVPGRNNNNRRYKMEGGKDETLLIETNFIDYDYLETYGIPLLSGRPFNESFSGENHTCLVNESAIRDFGITDPEKTRFMYGRTPDKMNYLDISGVVKDFHFRSLHNKIGPYMFRLGNDDFPAGYLSVKLLSGNYQETISAIGNKWDEFTGKKSLEYYFMDDDFEKMYRTEKQNGQIAMIFSILALFIASLGLFGLTSFTTEQRTKEIGVRKAMGASIISIYIEISKEILILVSISALIAWPVIYYYAGKWLENFYYKINPGAFTFVAGLIIALIIAILTISYRVISAARVNPAQSLKYE